MNSLEARDTSAEDKTPCLAAQKVKGLTAKLTPFSISFGVQFVVVRRALKVELISCESIAAQFAQHLL